MKKLSVLTILLLLASTLSMQAQLLKQLKTLAEPEKTTSTEVENDSINTEEADDDATSPVSFSENEAGSGIKEALISGVSKGVAMVSKEDGYFGDELIKIPFPEEVEFVASKLSAGGMGDLVDKAVLSMNRAAEDAASTAKDIFVGAIKEMSITDAINIVKGENNAATKYLQDHTTSELTDEFSPIIEGSLTKVNATKYWDDVMNAYNKLPMVKKVNPNLTGYVTEKAIAGLFVKIADEEKAIRENPMERTTDLLKKIFK